MKSQKKNILLAAAGVGLLIVGGIAGWYIHKPSSSLNGIAVVRENPADYKFIDPVLLLQIPEDTTTPEFQSLKNTINGYILNAKSQGKATDISIYFRQLHTDRWFGINADENYAPASLLKVVDLIAFYRRAQQDQSLYSSNVTIADGDINTDSNQDYYPPQNPIQVGQTYSAQDLISHMIIDSDNNAAFALDQVIGNDTLNKTYDDLGIPNPNNTFSIDFVSPHQFSHIFRSLYNGAYLSDPISEQVLELMSKSNFTQGLVAGVPAGTIVSHKFGERTITIQDTTAPQPSVDTIHELHDCGIIYAPNNPYLLCIMTKGGDFSALQKIISDISALTWNSMAQLSQK